MKYLIVGLGNPTMEYLATRHNIGFRVADALAAAVGAQFATERYGWVARGRAKSAQLVILKPSTYMNLSGQAVRYWMDKENIPLEQVLVAVDDLALPFGTLRLRSGGSDAGHNGLKDIARCLGSEAYARLRFGIGNDYQRGAQINFVLGQFTAGQEKAMPQLLATCVDAIKCFCLEGIARAMNRYNTKRQPQRPHKERPDGKAEDKAADSPAGKASDQPADPPRTDGVQD